MPMSDELWSDCWSALIFIFGNMDRMKSLSKERNKPLPGETYQGKVHPGEIHPIQIYPREINPVVRVYLLSRGLSL